MAYTSAVFLKTHRVSKIVQHYLPRRALADIEYKNYRIKKVKFTHDTVHCRLLTYHYFSGYPAYSGNESCFFG